MNIAKTYGAGKVKKRRLGKIISEMPFSSKILRITGVSKSGFATFQGISNDHKQISKMLYYVTFTIYVIHITTLQ